MADLLVLEEPRVEIPDNTKPLAQHLRPKAGLIGTRKP
jgi:hypothetical protein